MKYALIPWFAGSHDSPPSEVRYTPPVDIATLSREGSDGCGSTVWIACPPKPAPQSLRCGWSHSPRTSSKVTPPSADFHSDEGCAPAYTTPGWSAGAGWICQTRSSDASASAGKPIEPSGGSFQVLPRSSLWKTAGPQCSLVPPVNRRGRSPRVSIPTE